MTGERSSPESVGVPVLHVVTDDGVLARAGFPELAASIMGTGGSRVALHLRGPRTRGGALYGLTGELRGPAAASHALLVVNDRVDVALAGKVGAVHLGRRSLSVADARRILGTHARIGVSTHSDDEAAEAAADGAQWMFAGTIYETPSHPDRAARGPEAIVGARRAGGGRPVIGIGGITPERVREVCGAGAHGIAVIRGVWDARSPLDALNRYLDALAAVAGEGAETA